MLGQKPGGGNESLGAGVTNICMRPSELTPGGVGPRILTKGSSLRKQPLQPPGRAMLKA